MGFSLQASIEQVGFPLDLRCQDDSVIQTTRWIWDITIYSVGWRCEWYKWCSLNSILLYKPVSGIPKRDLQPFVAILDSLSTEVVFMECVSTPNLSSGIIKAQQISQFLNTSKRSYEAIIRHVWHSASSRLGCDDFLKCSCKGSRRCKDFPVKGRWDNVRGDESSCQAGPCYSEPGWILMAQWWIYLSGQHFETCWPMQWIICSLH